MRTCYRAAATYLRHCYHTSRHQGVHVWSAWVSAFYVDLLRYKARLDLIGAVAAGFVNKKKKVWEKCVFRYLVITTSWQRLRKLGSGASKGVTGKRGTLLVWPTSRQRQTAKSYRRHAVSWTASSMPPTASLSHALDDHPRGQAGLAVEFRKFWKLGRFFLPLPSPSSLHMSLVNFMSATIQHYRLDYPAWNTGLDKRLGQREHVCNIGTIDNESAGISGGLVHFRSVKRRRWVHPARRLKGAAHPLSIIDRIGSHRPTEDDVETHVCLLSLIKSDVTDVNDDLIPFQFHLFTFDYHNVILICATSKAYYR